MKRAMTILSAFGLVLAFALPIWAQGTRLPTHTVTVAGTVDTIDKDKRVVVLRTAEGKFDTIEVPASAKRFDELKVGDKVSVTYNNSVAVRPHPPGTPPINTGATATSMGMEQRPGGTTTVQREMTATVDSIDPKNSAVTLVGPNGWKYIRRVVDPAVFQKVKVGDQVDIMWNTDLTVKVE